MKKHNLSLGNTFNIIVTVITVVPELKVVVANTDPVNPDKGEFQLHIWKDTPGVDGSTLKLGDRVECTITNDAAPQILNAKLVP